MKRLTSLAFALLIVLTAMADGPFRAHRYDSYKVMPISGSDIVFIGNSITDMHGWTEAFGAEGIANRGNSGALSAEILDNLETYIAGRPRQAYLMIGTNDLGSGYTPEYVGENVRRIVQRIKDESPETDIYLESILPSTVGSRTLENEMAANVLIQQVASDFGATYVDLWDDLFSICQNQTHTLDGLHMKASGYKIWCDKIAGYLGHECVYPSNTLELQNTGGASGSHGMRATYFSVLPITSNDVLVFGDEMIKNGEWNELLHNSNVKNRGTNWGYDGTGTSIALTTCMVDATFSNPLGSNEEPKSIVLYTGTGDVNNSTSMSIVEGNYSTLLNKIRAYAPSSTIYLVSLMPTATANQRINTFNDFLRATSEMTERVEYIDIYSTLASDGITNPDYFVGNYLYGKGYVEVARILANYLEGCTVLSNDEIDTYYNYITLRNTLGSFLYLNEKIHCGESIGQYSEENFNTILSKAEEARLLLCDGGIIPEDFILVANELCTSISEDLESINKPEFSEIDFLVHYALYTPSRNNRFVSSTGLGNGLVGATNSNNAASHWAFYDRGDGSVDIINCNDYSYIDPASAAYNTQLYTTATQPEKGWQFSYSNLGSDTASYLIVYCDDVQLHQTNSSLSWKVYNWSTNGDGRDRNDAGGQYYFKFIESVTGTEEQSSAFSIKPNPANDLLIIDFDESFHPSELRLINSAGQIVIDQHISKENGQYTLPVDSLSKGVYSITLSDRRRQHSKKVVIK